MSRITSPRTEREINDEIIKSATDLVRIMRNRNSSFIIAFDTESVTYPFEELERKIREKQILKNTYIKHA